MIKSREPMSMAESLKYIKDAEGSDEGEAEIKKFIKKFVKLSPADAHKIREKLTALDLVKLKSEYIVKIIDTMPEDRENLNKVFVDVNLDENESKQVLDILGEFR